ncbi:hypothetical protein Tco_0439040 [Tanacetum coccineum]
MASLPGRGVAIFTGLFCGVNLLNGTCLNCTYGDGKPVTCCGCEGPLKGGFCSFCASRNENSFAYDPKPNSFNNDQNFSDYLPQPQYPTYTCELCGNNAHYGFDCPPQVSFVYNQNPVFDQNFDINFPQTSPNFSQQNLVCENCGGFHATFQCQTMNQNFNYSNSFGLDQIQPSQFSTVQLLEIERINKEESFKKKDMSIEEIMSEKRLIDDDINDITNDLSYKRFRDYSGLDIEMRKKERVLMEEKYLAASQCIKSICNYDDDEDDSIPLRDIIARYSPSVAITSSPSVLPTREPKDSLIMGDEHLSTIPEKESDEVIKSSVENLVLLSSESEDFSDNESECDMPEYDETSPTFTTFSNPLIDSNDDITSSDDESLSDEDVPMENFKIYSNPLFDDEEIISPKIDPHYFNAESNLIESLLNGDILIDSSPKFDYLLEEFSGELAHIDPIPPGIEKADFDLEEEIRLVENLLYDNSSSRPPEELNLEIADTIFESLSPSPILVEDSDSLMEEINLFLASDDSMLLGIEDDDYDSEGDIRFLEVLLNNDSLSLPENESSNLDHFNDPSPSCPPPEPSDVEICFDFKPDKGVVTNKVVGDISEHDVLMPNLLPTQPTLCPVFDLLLSFSSENEDKVFNPGILISPLLSYWGEITSNFYKSPMLISGGDIPHLDVPFLHFYPLNPLKCGGIESGSRLGFFKIMKIRACFQSSNHPVFDLLLIKESLIMIFRACRIRKILQLRILRYPAHMRTYLPQDPPSPDYVPGPEEPMSAPPSPFYVPFVSELLIEEDPEEDVQRWNLEEDQPTILLDRAVAYRDQDPYLLYESGLGCPSDPGARHHTLSRHYPDQSPPPNSPTYVEGSWDPVLLDESERCTTFYLLGPTQLRADLYGFADMLDAAPGCQTSRELGYGITDTWDDLVGAIQEIAPTTLEEVITLLMRRSQEYLVRLGHSDGCLRSGTFLRAYLFSLRYGSASSRSTELQAADRRRQTVISDLLKADHRRQRQLVEALKIVKSLKTQMIELQRQQGPAKDPAEPELPEEASSSS